MLFGRRRKRLADASELYIGPHTKRFREVQKHLRQSEEAVDRGRCPDAMIHLYEAHELMQIKPDVGVDMHQRYADVKRQIKASCRTSFAARHPRRRRRRRAQR